MCVCLLFLPRFHLHPCFLFPHFIILILTLMCYFRPFLLVVSYLCVFLSPIVPFLSAQFLFIKNKVREQDISLLLLLHLL